MVLGLPILAFFSWISFRKWGLNYCENIVANAFLTAASLIYSILIVVPVQYLLRDNPNMFMTIPTLITMVLMIGLTFWFFIQLYPQKATGSVILRVLLMYGIMFVLYIITVIAAVFYVIMTNPDKFRPH